MVEFLPCVWSERKPRAWNLISIDKIDYRKGYVSMIVLARANDARFRYK
jgi:hypothetical protein